MRVIKIHFILKHGHSSINWMYKGREMKSLSEMEEIIPVLPVDHVTVLQVACNTL